MRHWPLTWTQMKLSNHARAHTCTCTKWPPGGAWAVASRLAPGPCRAAMICLGGWCKQDHTPSLGVLRVNTESPQTWGQILHDVQGLCGCRALLCSMNSQPGTGTSTSWSAPWNKKFHKDRVFDHSTTRFTIHYHVPGKDSIWQTLDAW